MFQLAGWMKRLKKKGGGERKSFIIIRTSFDILVGDVDH